MKNIIYWIFLLSFISCNYTQKVKDGSTAYERKQYSIGIPMLKKEYQKSKSRIEKGKIAYQLADSYRFTNQMENAIEWYQIAYDYGVGVDALAQYAYALKEAGKYDEAKEAFKNAGLEIGSPYEYRRQIQSCELAKDWQGKNSNKAYQVEETNIGYSASNYAPQFYKNQQLVFTSDYKTEASQDATYKWTGRGFSNLYAYDLQSGVTENFSSVLNTKANEGTAVFNKDFTEVIFTRCWNDDQRSDAYCQLYSSQRIGNDWSNPEPLSFTVEGINYMQPALSSDEKTLYFSSDSDEGWGGFDIFYSQREGDEWAVPRVMSRGINTTGNENFPTLHHDTLYFSSDYHAGMGGLDIFKTYKMGERWSPVHNLRHPINSSKDDFGLVINPHSTTDSLILQTGYFSSSRNANDGTDALFAFKKIVPPAPPIVDTIAIDTTPVVYQIKLNVFVLEKIYRDPSNPNSKILGRKPLEDAQLQNLSAGEIITTQQDAEGQFTFTLAEETNYNFIASKKGYLKNAASFSTKGITPTSSRPIVEFELEIELDKVFKNREITLDNIYYDFDDWAIRSDAEPTLRKLASTLAQNPDIKIELASHTDCRGQSNYNQSLSQKRAEAAVAFLIDNGIAAERLTAVGYGENKLAIDCSCQRCSDEEHQANRRTTFKIVE